MRAAGLAVGLLAALPAAAEWSFGEPATVFSGGEGVFPHLEAAGRASIAPAGDAGMALIWEDNRSGAPQVYAALGRDGAFAETRISTGGQAYEPAVVSLDQGGWLAAWEQDGAVWLRRFGTGAPGPAVRIGEGEATQPTLARGADGSVYAAWARRDGRFNRIIVAALRLEGSEPQVIWERPAEAEPPTGQQLYPALAVVEKGPVVAWEDRRHGHTRILYARWDGEGFGETRTLNDQPDMRNVQFGRGYGVTRVALADGGGRAAATWMDKREFQGGYDTFAALLGEEGFGENERVQDLFGENQPQWHPDVAVSPAGDVVVAWDDPRDGTPDVWYSWREGEGEWSSDAALAAGPGAETHPVVAFGPDGVLHAAWVERGEDGTSRIRYAWAAKED